MAPTQVEVHGNVLPWALLQRGFVYRGERVPLASMQGIFKPRVMELPLSRSSFGGRTRSRSWTAGAGGDTAPPSPGGREVRPYTR